MPDRPPHPARPGHPDDADLLAFIEGTPLPRERETAVARALEADARLAARLERMRRDREALRSLPAIPAPPGLIDAVEAALQPMLERRMLLGLRDGAPLESRPPVSIVQPARRSVLATIFAERAGRYSALAAGLLLLIGGAAYWAANSLWPSTAPAPVTIARNTQPKPLTPVEVGTPEGATLAAKAPQPEPAPAAPERSEPAPAAIAATPTVHEPMALAATDAAPTADALPSAMSNDQAIRLASENRLVIRLIAPDPVVLAHPERIADQIRRTQSSGWRVGDAAPAELASLLNAAPSPVFLPLPAYERPNLSIAGNAGFQAPEFVGPPAPAPWIPPPTPTVYLVQTRLDGAALDGLRNALAPYGDPVLEEAPQALPLDGASLNPAAVIWWSQPPSGWTSWASVPVVIDQPR